MCFTLFRADLLDQVALITASHNPEEDNGIKLIDPDGGMLDFFWESLATGLVNCAKNEFEEKIKSIMIGNGVDETRSQGTVLLGWDSR